MATLATTHVNIYSLKWQTHLSLQVRKKYRLAWWGVPMQKAMLQRGRASDILCIAKPLIGLVQYQICSPKAVVFVTYSMWHKLHLCTLSDYQLWIWERKSNVPALFQSHHLGETHRKKITCIYYVHKLQRLQLDRSRTNPCSSNWDRSQNWDQVVWDRRSNSKKRTSFDRSLTRPHRSQDLDRSGGQWFSDKWGTSMLG